jgi:ATP-dependent DNA helicase RecQ
MMKLQRMIDYAYSGCRRRYVLEYFGDTPPWERCGTCDACRAGKPLGRKNVPVTADQRLVVRKVLSCIARMKTPYSPSMVAKVLMGSQDEKIRAMRLDQLSTYGILSQNSLPELESILDEMVRAGALLRQTMTREIGGRERTYFTLSLSERGWELMRDPDIPFAMVWPADAPKTRTPPPKKVGDLQSALTDLRRRLAKAEDVPLYAVAPNRTLEDMASVRPMTRQAMLDIHGMGKERYAKYGNAFMEEIRRFCSGARD